MKKQLLPVTIFIASILGPASALASQQTAPPPDSTKVNRQGGPTADDQSQTKADLALVQRIRQGIVKDKTLSTTAHNCKVITRDGTVMLRGPVMTQQEKDAIAAIATKIAGKGKVTNELVVKSTK